MADFNNAMFSDHSGHLRMVVTYWDMAAALVNDGAIRPELFNDCNGEHISVFAKVEPLLPEIRAAYAPNFAASLEKLIDATPNGRQRCAMTRERMKGIRANLAKQQAQTVYLPTTPVASIVSALLRERSNYMGSNFLLFGALNRALSRQAAPRFRFNLDDARAEWRRRHPKRRAS